MGRRNNIKNAARYEDPVTVRRRWRVRFSVNGHRVDETIDGATTPAEVRAFIKQRRAELQLAPRPSSNGSGGAPRVSDLLAAFHEVRPDLKPHLKAVERYLLDVLHDPRVRDVTPGDVEEFLAWRRSRAPDGTRRETPLTGRTLNKERATLSLLFGFARKKRWAPVNVVRETEAREQRRREPVILDDDTYEDLLEAASARDPQVGLYALLLGETALRTRVEGAALRWDQLDLDEGFVVVGATKTEAGANRLVPLTPRLRDALRAWEREHRACGEWVFHHEVSRRRGVAAARAGERFAPVTLGRRLKAVAVDIGIPKAWVPYDLRHRCITAWAKRATAAVVQVAAGHSDIRMTQWYTHLKRDRAALRTLLAPGADLHKVDLESCPDDGSSS